MPLDFDKLLPDFSAHLTLEGVRISDGAAADALASFASSQFLLLAGPSGTGKSSLARALATFFSEQIAVVDAEPSLLRPQDLAGYASALSGTPEYVGTPATEQILKLRETAHADSPPVLLVEEANLSPVEGYLAPLTHGLSGLSAERIVWPMHSSGTSLPLRGDQTGSSIPGEIPMSPFPRLLATINVDASAPAPANKVSARATVLLLEPPPLDEVVNLEFPVQKAAVVTAPPGRGTVGDPRDALLTRVANDEDQPLREELKHLGEIVLENRRRLSPRMAQRALMYQAAYEAIAVSASGALGTKRARHGAENALLHLLLPVLSPTEFTLVAHRLREAADENGLVNQRLHDLNLDSDDWQQAPDDFWSGLS